MNKTELQRFRNHMVKCAADAGVKLEIGTITYHDSYFSFSSKAYLGEDGKREEFTKHAAKKGVPADWYGKEFIGTDGNEYTIVGIKPRGRKNVLDIEDSAGKGFVCNKGFVRRIIRPVHPAEDRTNREKLTITKKDVGVIDPYLLGITNKDN